MKFYLQSGGIRDSMTDSLIDTCEFNKFDYGIFNLIPFTDRIYYDNSVDNILPSYDGVVYPIGSTRLVDLYYKQLLPSNWVIFHNKNTFNPFTIKNSLGDYYFNNDIEEVVYEDIANFKSSEDYFIKPLYDDKLINGMVIPNGSTLNEILNSQTGDIDRLKGKSLIISSVKQPELEVRFFVVGNKISAHSVYKYRDSLTNISRLISHYELETCKDIINLYHPTECFVVDLNISNNGKISVIEYNTINCSGFYQVNLNTLLSDIKDYVTSSIKIR